MASDQDFIATFTVPAFVRGGGGQPQVQKVKLPGQPSPGPSPGPGPSTPPPSTPPPTPPKTLLEKCVASFMLPDSTPNPGCEAGQAQHDRWMKWLADAFPAPGVFADKIEGALGCLQGGQTTCTHVLYKVYAHFGIPSKYWPATGGDASIIPAWWKNQYIKTITPDSLPRRGDPCYVADPKAHWTHAHHAIFDSRASDNPPSVGGYSGGWANPKAPMASYDAGPYKTPSPLAQDDAGTMILIGTPPDAHGLGGSQKKIWWYTDMWAFFRDHSAEIKPVKEGLA